MTEPMSRMRLAEEIARAFAREDIQYAVAHGTYGYPQSIGRDLDLVITLEDARKAILLAVDVAAQCGYTNAFSRWSHWGLYQLSLVRDDEREAMPIDFCIGLWRAKWIQLLTPEIMSRMIAGDDAIGPFRLTEEGRFIKACLRALLCGDLRRFGREFPMPVTIPEQVRTQWLLELIGPFGMSLLASSSVEELEARYSLRRLQGRWAARHPLGALRSLVLSIYCRLQRAAFDAANVLVVETPRPDAVRKAVEALKPEMQKLFLELNYYDAPKGGLAMKFGHALGWRKLPVSEFCLAVVARKANAGQVRAWAGKGRRSLDADCYFSLPELDAETLQEQLRRFLLDFVYDRYKVESAVPANRELGQAAGVRV